MPRQRLTRPVNVSVVVLALGVAVLDSLTKLWARHELANGPRHVVGPLWFRLTYNTGISFSINRTGPIWTTLMALVIAVQAAPGLATVGFGLLLGGGVANEVNRLVVVPHQVTDFISVGWFPVFNVADAAVTLGFCALIVAMLRGSTLVEK